MARPRIFISSTYYDLKHIRSAMEVFVEGFGYEAVLFESGDIPFSHTEPLDESCYKEIQSCHILVLLIGGRYGSPVSDADSDDEVKSKSSGRKESDALEKHYEFFNSITRREFETAQSSGLPVYIFIEKGVAAEYLTYKENRRNNTIKYAHVDSVNVFKLLDSIYALKKNNLVKEFERFEDISSWLRDQWAGLFAGFLMRQNGEATLNTLAQQMVSLESITNALKGYSEKLIQKLTPEISDDVIRETNVKIRKDSALAVFVKNAFVRHLASAHEANIEGLFEVFMSTDDYSEFVRLSRPLMKSRCGAMRGTSAREALQNLREELGMKFFENSETVQVVRRNRRLKKDDEES